MPCSQAFRSSAPSEHLPSSRGGRFGRRARVGAAAQDQWNGGSASVRRATSTELPDRVGLEGVLPRPVRSRGFLDRDECVQEGQIPHQQVRRAEPIPHQDVRRAEPIPNQQARRAEPPVESTGEYAGSALPGAQISSVVGRHAPAQVRDMAAEWAGWTSGELPGQLAAWSPGPQTAPDQPPASA